MKLKKRIISKTPIPDLDTQEINSRPFSIPQPELIQFQKAMVVNELHQYGVMREWYEKLFNEFPPEKPFLLLRLKIEYELLKKGYENANVDLTPTLKLNYQAAQSFDVNKFNPSFQNIIRSVIDMPTKAATKENITSAKPVVNKQAKVAKETVTQTYIRLFESQGKFTDEQLAGKMCDAHPDKKKYTPQDIAAVRSLYNNGKLSGQKGKPKVPATKFIGAVLKGSTVTTTATKPKPTTTVKGIKK